MEDEFIPERPVPIVYTLSQQKQIIIEYIKKLIQQIEDYKNYVKLSRGNPAMDINRRIIEKKINNLKNNFGSIIKNFILSRILLNLLITEVLNILLMNSKYNQV